MRNKKKEAKRLTKFKTHHKVIVSIFATIGAVAVWRGIWQLFDSLPYFDKPVVSITVAFAVIIIAGIYFKFTEFW